MLRLFKRAFKMNEIPLDYSKGFNPHPKMGFAQPLSLGYTASNEFIEFETVTPCDTEKVNELMTASMPLGIKIAGTYELNTKAKSLASIVEEALYTVSIPKTEEVSCIDFDKVIEDYLAQKEILAEKKQKKTKKIITKHIKDQIKGIQAVHSDTHVKLKMMLDCGSNSNLSPESVITTLCKFASIDVPRYEISVNRDCLIFKDNYIPA